ELYGFRNPRILGQYTSFTPHLHRAKSRRSKRLRAIFGIWIDPGAHLGECVRLVGSSKEMANLPPTCATPADLALA
ncbi:MAG: hypothetical protein KY456_14645, partial [Chloroflexi bacterium]|nr:hypothetical protein [Chloroflexota bacterium]